MPEEFVGLQRFLWLAVSRRTQRFPSTIPHPRVSEAFPRGATCESRKNTSKPIAFEVSSKRRIGFPSETHVKRGDRVVALVPRHALIHVADLIRRPARETACRRVDSWQWSVSRNELVDREVELIGGKQGGRQRRIQAGKERAVCPWLLGGPGDDQNIIIALVAGELRARIPCCRASDALIGAQKARITCVRRDVKSIAARPV